MIAYNMFLVFNAVGLSYLRGTVLSVRFLTSSTLLVRFRVMFDALSPRQGAHSPAQFESSNSM